MQLRGERECADCGARWSYYDTGAIVCPECGSPDTVAVDEEQAIHTDSEVEFDLSPVRNDVDEIPREDLAVATRDACREYVRKRGFVRGGELLPLDDTYVAARELAGLADIVRRSTSLTDEEEWYFLELLRGADVGERPPAADVPDSLRAVRGLATANAVRDYRRDVRQWIDGEDEATGSAFASEVLGTIQDHVRRIRALQGDVPVAQSEALLAATRDLGAYLRAQDPDGLASARERLAGLEDQD